MLIISPGWFVGLALLFALGLALISLLAFSIAHCLRRRRDRGRHGKGDHMDESKYPATGQTNVAAPGDTPNPRDDMAARQQHRDVVTPANQANQGNQEREVGVEQV
jgi:hypothetical protein